MLKRFLSNLLILSLILTMAVGCGKTTNVGSDNGENNDLNEEVEANSDSDVTNEQVLTYCFGENPESLDPGLSNENYGINILVNTFEGLIKVNDNGEVMPAVAKSWDISKDGLEYTFTLDKNAKWSDGKPVTSYDFEYAWKRAANPETASEFAYLFYYLKNGEGVVEGELEPDKLGVEATDEYTLKVLLESPTNYIFDIISFVTYFPLRKDIIELDPERWTLDQDKLKICNGPFQVEKWSQNEEIILVRNENYRNAKEIKLDKIIIPVITEVSTAFTAYNAGELDGSYRVPATEIQKLIVESDEFNINTALGIEYMEFNINEEPFNDIKVRKALTLAINRRDITSRVTLGGEEPLVGLVPYGIHLVGEDFREAGGDYGIDPEKAKIMEAKQLLAEAGYPNGEGLPVIKLNIISGSLDQRIGEVISKMWKENLGIEVELVPQESTVHYDTLIAGDFQVGRAGWHGDYVHPMTFLDMWITGSGANETNYNNEEYDSLIEKSKITLDIAESVKYMHQAEDLWMNQYVICPLYCLSQPVLMKKYVKNFEMTSTSLLYFDKTYIEKTK